MMTLFEYIREKHMKTFISTSVSQNQVKLNGKDFHTIGEWFVKLQNRGLSRDKIFLFFQFIDPSLVVVIPQKKIVFVITSSFK